MFSVRVTPSNVTKISESVAERNVRPSAEKERGSDMKSRHSFVVEEEKIGEMFYRLSTLARREADRCGLDITR